MRIPEIKDFVVKVRAAGWKALGAFYSSSSVTYLLQRGLFVSLYSTNVFLSLLLPVWIPSMPFLTRVVLIAFPGYKAVQTQGHLDTSL